MPFTKANQGAPSAGSSSSGSGTVTSEAPSRTVAYQTVFTGAQNAHLPLAPPGEAGLGYNYPGHGVRVLAANAARIKALLVNADPAVTAYIRFGGTGRVFNEHGVDYLCRQNEWSMPLAPNQAWEERHWKGDIFMAWPGQNGGLAGSTFTVPGASSPQLQFLWNGVTTGISLPEVTFPIWELLWNLQRLLRAAYVASGGVAGTIHCGTLQNDTDEALPSGVWTADDGDASPFPGRNAIWADDAAGAFRLKWLNVATRNALGFTRSWDDGPPAYAGAASQVWVAGTATAPTNIIRVAGRVSEFTT